MGRALDLLIAVATIAVALFGLGSGSYIYTQFSGASLGVALVGMSAVGGVFGFAKLVRVRGESTTSGKQMTSGPRRL
jgi:hypothetical protein